MLTAGLGRGGEEGRGPEGADLEAELGSQVEEEVWASTARQRPAGGRGRGACRHRWVVQDRGFWDESHEGRRGARERRLLGCRGSHHGPWLLKVGEAMAQSQRGGQMN